MQPHLAETTIHDMITYTVFDNTHVYETYNNYHDARARVERLLAANPSNTVLIKRTSDVIKRFTIQ